MSESGAQELRAGDKNWGINEQSNCWYYWMRSFRKGMQKSRSRPECRSTPTFISRAEGQKWSMRSEENQARVMPRKWQKEESTANERPRKMEAEMHDWIWQHGGHWWWRPKHWKHHTAGDTGKAFNGSLFSFLPSSIHSFSKYLLSTYYVPGNSKALQIQWWVRWTRALVQSHLPSQSLPQQSRFKVSQEPIRHKTSVDTDKDDSFMGKFS